MDKLNTRGKYLYLVLAEEGGLAPPVVPITVEQVNSWVEGGNSSTSSSCSTESTDHPQIELSAALLGVRLSQEVTKYLDLDIRKKYFWSDSKTVLHWLQRDEKLQTYVSVRVGEMLEHTEVEQWRWVLSSDNVTDDCTRDTPNEKFNSESVETIINILKKDCWIPRIRSMVGKTIKECPYYKRRKAKQVEPKMGLLPKKGSSSIKNHFL
ncbi:hypothetical protein JTB14_002136 [Gonioctena quinquepunctata]|nr:hypothetical protein JTB14_002136 [Gonioctena quinquepunctata]